jgi:hypothetical protein
MPDVLRRKGGRVKYAVIVAVTGLMLVSAFLYLTPDLRGWTPTDFRDPATSVEPTKAGSTAFAIGDCFPGTIAPWNIPAAVDGQQFESQPVLTCRSRSSLLRTVGIYLLAATVLLLIYRRRSASKEPW